LVCTISTDDPMVFGNRINDEYRVAAEEMGLDRTALALLARNGFSVALMDTAEKNRHLADWESLMYGR
jgi:adenosine deaminase